MDSENKEISNEGTKDQEIPQSKTWESIDDLVYAKSGDIIKDGNYTVLNYEIVKDEA